MGEKLFKYKLNDKFFGPVPLSRLILMHHHKELSDKVEVIMEEYEGNRTILLGVLIKAVKEKFRSSKKNLTLKEFANQLGTPLNMLKEHASKAGLKYESPESIVYEDHKIILLEYFKKISEKKNKNHKKSKKKSFRLSYLVFPSLLFLLILSLIDIDNIAHNLEDDHSKIENLQTQFNKLPKEEKKKIQYALLSKGYYKGAIDSFWGKETQNALTQYADNKGIEYYRVLDKKPLLKDLIIPHHIYIEDYPQPIDIVTKHIYHKGKWSARFPFKIETSGEKNYFVKLVDKKNGTDVMTILIKKGEKFDGKAPAGYFGLKYASGDYWYGNELHFGPDTQYEESMTGLHFHNYDGALNGHSLRLYQVLNGNLRTKKIDDSSF
jgi:cell division protein FtsB